VSVVALKEADAAVYVAAERVLVLRRKLGARLPEVIDAQRDLVTALIAARLAMEKLASLLQVDPAQITATADVDAIVPPVIEAAFYEEPSGTVHARGGHTLQFGEGVFRA
jgi:hypothetical protein